MPNSVTTAGCRALHGADSGAERSVRFRTAGAPQGATLGREKRRGARVTIVRQCARASCRLQKSVSVVVLFERAVGCG